MSMRSHDDASSKAPRPTPSADAARTARCTEGVRDVAEDITVVAETLMHCAYGVPGNNVELLRSIVDIRRLTEDAIGLVVVRQRSQGRPLSELSPITELTEDRLRKKYRPTAVDRSLSHRVRPKLAPARSAAAGSDTPILRHPRQRLASALTLIVNGSGHLQRTIAIALGVHESYVSRMLSGQRDSSWRYVAAICELCDHDPELIKPLWEVAASCPPSDTDPVQYLRTYLRGLHFALGSPKRNTIIASAQNTITADEVDSALDGPGLPDWRAVEQITYALQSLPNAARPLWRRAQAAIENRPADTDPSI
ncbi:helix-turn-helix domain-containing protein [Streptomyces sp. NPDC090023]|uniref:helix-turn-helix domain-containing protein n=1 Tax=unclassified Streptomyces TaxID=2593676 RepID=UPI003808B64E